ncbi:hypothetical protein EXIGLDRAFT_303115 [Exidia glandulosa HHB12029]|uniref:Uncharacterized protein n=1 Tax=Exidia glandulosa HHB12029 TaxID=1314781 RepID=A0A165LY56_EXIGL|nr:hypothetical protein EXIGLDRAFT_303115 [Exidia glandulosa HHB12029]
MELTSSVSRAARRQKTHSESRATMQVSSCEVQRRTSAFLDNQRDSIGYVPSLMWSRRCCCQCKPVLGVATTCAVISTSHCRVYVICRFGHHDCRCLCHVPSPSHPPSCTSPGADRWRCCPSPVESD